MHQLHRQLQLQQRRPRSVQRMCPLRRRPEIQLICRQRGLRRGRHNSRQVDRPTNQRPSQVPNRLCSQLNGQRRSQLRCRRPSLRRFHLMPPHLNQLHPQFLDPPPFPLRIPRALLRLHPPRTRQAFLLRILLPFQQTCRRIFLLFLHQVSQLPFLPRNRRLPLPRRHLQCQVKLPRVNQPIVRLQHRL